MRRWTKSWAMRLLGRSAVTAFFVLVMFLCGVALHRIWIDDTLTIGPFSGDRSTNGEDFARLVLQDLRRIESVFNAPQEMGGVLKGTTAAGAAHTASRATVLGELSLGKAGHGGTLSTLAQTVGRHLRRRREVRGSVSRRDDGYFAVVARLRLPRGGGTTSWSLPYLKSLGEASFAVATRVFRKLQGKQSPVASELRALSDDAFHLFVRLVERQQAYLALRDEHFNDAWLALQRAADLAAALQRRKPIPELVARVAGPVLEEQQQEAKILAKMKKFRPGQGPVYRPPITNSSQGKASAGRPGTAAPLQRQSATLSANARTD